MLIFDQNDAHITNFTKNRMILLCYNPEKEEKEEKKSIVKWNKQKE